MVSSQNNDTIFHMTSILNFSFYFIFAYHSSITGVLGHTNFIRKEKIEKGKLMHKEYSFNLYTHPCSRHYYYYFRDMETEVQRR